jgi:hypothetical protein
MKPRKPKKYIPLHAQLAGAYEELSSQFHGKLTQEMINNLVDPERKIPLQQLRAAYRKANIRLPHGRGGRPKKTKKREVTKSFGHSLS